MLSAEALQRQLRAPAPNPGNAHTYTQLILTEAGRIKNQVEQVLQTAQVEKETLRLDKKPLDLHALIREVSASLDVLLRQHNATLELRLLASHPVVSGDSLHLTNVLFNLIDNACKYSDGPPTIGIATENMQGQLWLSVSDQGRGIAREEQKKVFERFYRIAPDQGPAAKGFGLGLYYVRQVMQAHRGKILVKSVLGQGSSFLLKFPKSVLS